MSVYREMASSHPDLATGRVRCKTCGNERRVDSAECLRHGWPTCCGETMELRSQGDLQIVGDPMTWRQGHLLIARYLDGRMDCGDRRVSKGLQRRGLFSKDGKRITPAGKAVAVEMLRQCLLSPKVLESNMDSVRDQLARHQQRTKRNHG